MKQIVVKRANNILGCNYLRHLGDPIRHKSLYKYMDLNSAILFIKSGFHFVEPSQWPDKYENRFYGANYNNLAISEKLHPKLLACCFTREKVNAAAWAVYSQGKDGLSSRCVQFSFNLKRLREGFDEYIMKNDELTIYEGVVTYMSETELNKIHKKNSPHYFDLFEYFDLDKYLSLLLLKRRAFEFEKEIRFIVNSKIEIQDSLDINIDWKSALECIRVDSKMTQQETTLFKNYCKYNGIDEKLIKPYNLNISQKRITIQ